jgi:hypothetical protein
LDDEYLRVALALRAETAAHPSMQKLKPGILRGLNKPQARGFADNVLGRRTTHEWLVTPAGAAVRALVHLLNDVSLDRVIGRIIRGLYFHHELRPVPSDAVVHVIHEFAFNEPTTARFIENVRSMESFEIGRGEFSYQAFTTEELPEITGILMTFYRGVSFLGLVGPATLATAPLAEQPSGAV